MQPQRSQALGKLEYILGITKALNIGPEIKSKRMN